MARMPRLHVDDFVQTGSFGGAGRCYYDLALQYLDDKTWFDPLSRTENVLSGRHAYGYVNSLCSVVIHLREASLRLFVRNTTHAGTLHQANVFRQSAALRLIGRSLPLPLPSG